MKTPSNNLLKVVVALVVLSVLTPSCAKDISVAPIAELNNNNVDIVTLKSYFAGLINADIVNIEYNAKTDKFSLWGVDQIDRSKLTVFYNNSQTSKK